MIGIIIHIFSHEDVCMSQVTEIVKNMFLSLLDKIIESGSVDTYMIFLEARK